MSNWQNFKPIRRELPKAGFGVKILAMIFMAVVGAAGGVFAVMYVLARPSRIRPTTAHTIEPTDLRFLLVSMALLGAIIGVGSVFRFWPKPEEVERPAPKVKKSPDERLAAALDALAEKLLAAGKVEWANRFLDAAAAPIKFDVRAQADAALRDIRLAKDIDPTEFEAELREALVAVTTARNAI